MQPTQERRAVAHGQAVAVGRKSPSLAAVTELAQRGEVIRRVDEAHAGTPCELQQALASNGKALAEEVRRQLPFTQDAAGRKVNLAQRRTSIAAHALKQPAPMERKPLRKRRTVMREARHHPITVQNRCRRHWQRDQRQHRPNRGPRQPLQHSTLLRRTAHARWSMGQLSALHQREVVAATQVAIEREHGRRAQGDHDGEPCFLCIRSRIASSICPQSSCRPAASFARKPRSGGSGLCMGVTRRSPPASNSKASRSPGPTASLVRTCFGSVIWPLLVIFAVFTGGPCYVALVGGNRKGSRRETANGEKCAMVAATRIQRLQRLRTAPSAVSLAADR